MRHTRLSTFPVNSNRELFAERLEVLDPRSSIHLALFFPLRKFIKSAPTHLGPNVLGSPHSYFKRQGARLSHNRFQPLQQQLIAGVLGKLLKEVWQHFRFLDADRDCPAPKNYSGANVSTPATSLAPARPAPPR